MPSELALILSLFARLLGFFLLSPLFSRLPVPGAVRGGLAIALTLLFAPLVLTQAAPMQPHSLLVQLIKETAIGYLMGAIFALLLEGAALAGQLVGTLAGFSAIELVDPHSSSTPGPLSKMFVLTVAVLIFALDLHHGLLKMLFESFSLIPLSSKLSNRPFGQELLQAFSLFFHTALDYAAMALFLLVPLLILFAIVTKIFSQFPIFWTAFPIQIFIGILVLIAILGDLPQVLYHAFQQTRTLVERILLDLTS